MSRIYLPVLHISNNRISITEEKAHYLASVLRCRKGDNLIVFDGEGNCLKTTIIKIDRREVIAEVIGKFPCNLESSVNIVLVQALLKGDKMDLVIQKTTELGVKEIIPVITERSQIRDTRKVNRWRKIAEEASRQSGRSVVPVIRELVEFKKFFSTQTSINYPPVSPLTEGWRKGCGFIFYEEGGMQLSDAVSSLVPRPSAILVVIGPEGGFTKEEIDLAQERDLIATTLGKRILRAETAAISAVTLVQFLLGDIG
jgi:16S rRNA (uracil1498-N3)-methyltransferase